MNTESICLPSDILIRRPVASDLEGVEPAELKAMWFETFHFRRSIPGAIVEYSSQWMKTVHAQEWIESLVKFLTLFRLGSIFYQGYDLETWSNRIFPSIGKLTVGKNRTTSSRFKYTINQADGPLLAKLFDAVARRIPTDEAPQNDVERRNPIRVAFPLFRDALLFASSDEARIASAISCLARLVPCLVPLRRRCQGGVEDFANRGREFRDSHSVRQV